MEAMQAEDVHAHDQHEGAGEEGFGPAPLQVLQVNPAGRGLRTAQQRQQTRQSWAAGGCTAGGCWGRMHTLAARCACCGVAHA